MEQVVSILRGHEVLVRPAPTLWRGHARELARAAVEQGDDLLLVCGGDGTINEAVNGMSPASVPLGILPAGTGNIAARELKLPNHPVRAARQLPSWAPRRIALGRAAWPAPATGLPRQAGPASASDLPAKAGLPVPAGTRCQYFLSVAGIGFDAYVIHKLAPERAGTFGVGSYILQALRQVTRYPFPRFACRLDGAEIQATSAMVQRTSRYAGWLRLAPEADFFQPQLTLCAFKSASRARYFVYAAAVALRRHGRLRDVELVPAEKVACFPADSRVSFELDGELVGELPASFELIPDALTILAP